MTESDVLGRSLLGETDRVLVSVGEAEGVQEGVLFPAASATKMNGRG